MPPISGRRAWRAVRPVRTSLHGSKLTPNCDPCDWPLLRTTGRLQCRLKRFLTSRPEIISVKDNLVSGAVVAELPLAATGGLANGFWSVGILVPCRLMTFRLF